MNPCGAVCDYARRPYTTKARLFRNSDQQVDLVWYPAREDAPVLPYDSSIVSLDYTADPLYDYGIGEVYGATRNYNGKHIKTEATGDHTCGSSEDFDIGCVRDTSLPPVEYYSNDLPTCCGMAPPIVYCAEYRRGVPGSPVVMPVIVANRIWRRTIPGVQIQQLRSPLETGSNWEYTEQDLPAGSVPTQLWTPDPPLWNGHGARTMIWRSGWAPSADADIHCTVE
jgi:hypothetical protein